MNDPSQLIDAIDKLLPQTQCGECDYPACRPYAEAIINNNESIDRCAPGGTTTLFALAKLLKQDPTPYIDTVKQRTRPPMLASIRENECIGCTKCIQACPVDAIIGSAKKMHTVITELCTGCDLCAAPCPVDCIDMIEVEQAIFDTDAAKSRYIAKQQRLAQQQQEKLQKHREKAQLNAEKEQDKQAKQAYIQAAIARVNNKKRQTHEQESN